MLEILYQDPWLVAINKPAGMLVHPGRDPEPADQIAMKVLRDQIEQRVLTIHRLDRPTSGVLIFALDPDAEVDLREQFAERRVSKTYRAVVLGETPEAWVSTEKLQKDEGEPFREAETAFKRDAICEVGDDVFSILTAMPKTGRFHQIRKHLAQDGTPIVGDFLYGEIELMERIADLIEQPRLMLHARELRFHHPVEEKEMTVAAPLPDRFSPFAQL